jgi:hypothetical protein
MRPDIMPALSITTVALWHFQRRRKKAIKNEKECWFIDYEQSSAFLQDPAKSAIRLGYPNFGSRANSGGTLSSACILSTRATIGQNEDSLASGIWQGYCSEQYIGGDVLP